MIKNYPEFTCYPELSQVLNNYPEFGLSENKSTVQDYLEPTFLIRKFVFFGWFIFSYPEIHLVEGNLICTIILLFFAKVLDKHKSCPHNIV